MIMSYLLIENRCK